jgi:hypothetical protein
VFAGSLLDEPRLYALGLEPSVFHPFRQDLTGSINGVNRQVEAVTVAKPAV